MVPSAAQILSQTSHRPYPAPRSPWLGRQSWRGLLLAHWALPPAMLSPHLPPSLEVDTARGAGWVSVVAYEMAEVGLRGMPAFARQRFPQLNLRTYVLHRGKPGIYFFSLDADNALAVLAGSLITGLPYYRATMHRRVGPSGTSFSSRRRGDPQVAFEAEYQSTQSPCAAGQLDRFLTERYVFYARQANGSLTAGEVCHKPWPLQGVHQTIQHNTLAARFGFPLNRLPDHTQYSSGVDVLFWRPGVVEA